MSFVPYSSATAMTKQSVKLTASETASNLNSAGLSRRNEGSLRTKNGEVNSVTAASATACPALRPMTLRNSTNTAAGMRISLFSCCSRLAALRASAWFRSSGLKSETRQLVSAMITPSLFFSIYIIVDSRGQISRRFHLELLPKSGKPEQCFTGSFIVGSARGIQSRTQQIANHLSLTLVFSLGFQLYISGLFFSYIYLCSYHMSF